MADSRRRRPTKLARMMPTLTALVLIFVILGISGVNLYIKKYAPSKEFADQTDYFGVSGNEVAIFLNEEKQQETDGTLVTGLYENGRVYLPLTFVQQSLNKRFYWAADKEQIFYTLPTETKKSGAQDLAADGAPVYLKDASGLFLNAAFVKEYTDIRYTSYTDGENKRIFVYDDWSPSASGTLKSDAAVRVLGGIKSPILTTAEADTQVKVLGKMEHWSKVCTSDGYIGYVQNKYLTDAGKVTEQSSFVAPEYTHMALADGKKVVLGFHQITNQKANATFDRAVQNANGMNVIAPTWFVLTDNAGGYTSYASADYVAKAHAKGLQVWATVNNFDGGDIDETVLLSSADTRAALISRLLAEVEEKGIDGINVDFELLPKAAGKDYVQFMRELSVACRNAQVLLSVDTYVPYAYNSYYDLGELGAYCDYVIVMCYDEHYAGGEAGSVASIGYLQDGIDGAGAVMELSRVVPAVPFYTRVWTVNGTQTSSDALGMADAQKWVDERAVKLTWDDTLGQSYGQIVDEKGTRKIWMEDERSMQLKIDTIKEAGAGGVACWKLMQEPETIWEIVNLNAAD